MRLQTGATRMKNFIRTNIYLSAAQKVALKKISRRRKVSAALALRELLDAALNLAASTTPYSHCAQRGR
jgi:hypothetical protein